MDVSNMREFHPIIKVVSIESHLVAHFFYYNNNPIIRPCSDIELTSEECMPSTPVNRNTSLSSSHIIISYHII